MQTILRAASIGIQDLGAFEELRTLAAGKVGKVPGELLSRHILAVTQGSDSPVRRAALAAVVRRHVFARRDELRVSSRPRNRSGLGAWTTKRKGRAPRPYQSWLGSVEPLIASCDCKDFIKGGLGLCKHLLVILEDLADRPAAWQRALEAGADQATRLPRLVWDPVRPLIGTGDWLSRVGWSTGEGKQAAGVPAELGRWFAGNGSISTAGETLTRDPQLRFEMVSDLIRFVRSSPRGNRPGCDPALSPLLDGEFQLLEQLRSGGVLCSKLDRALETLVRPLYPYQRKGVERFLERGRLLLGDDMGLGKTAQAIAACHVLWREGVVKRGLLVVPAPLKIQWEREWKSFSDAPIMVIDGRPAEREQIVAEQDEGFLITNYELVLRDIGILQRWAPEMMILDEAQRIKNWATKTAFCVKQLEPRFRLVLTGTPMENRLEELASIMDWVDERALEPRWRLEPWHATLYENGQQVPGARNLDTLRTRLKASVLRRTRNEVLDQLPSRTDTRAPVALTPAQKAEHADLEQPIASLLSRARDRPLTQAEFLRLMQYLTQQRIICNGLAQRHFEEVWSGLQRGGRPTRTLLRGLDSPKLEEIRELVGRVVVDGGQKMVIFSQWRRMLQLVGWSISDLLEDAGYRSAFFSGDESQARRRQNIVDFHDDPTMTVLLSTDAGGVGLNLQRAASCIVNLEMPWNPAVLEQRIGRVHRLGQKRPVQVYNLISEGGIESRIAQTVDDKQALFTGLFDGDSNEIRFSRSGRFLDRVEKLVSPEQAGVTEYLEPEELLDEVIDRDPGPPAAAVVDQARSPVAPPPAAQAFPPAAATQVQRLFAALKVEQTAAGGLRIEAPPEAASALAAVFQGLADLLADVSQGGSES